MTLRYDTDLFNWSKTQCPHANFVLKVGSIKCQECRYNQGRNVNDHTVECGCPEDKQLLTFEEFSELNS